MINERLSGKETEQLKSMLKQQPKPKLLDPKEKIGDKIPKQFPYRGQK